MKRIFPVVSLNTGTRHYEFHTRDMVIVDVVDSSTTFTYKNSGWVLDDLIFEIFPLVDRPKLYVVEGCVCPLTLYENFKPILDC